MGVIKANEWLIRLSDKGFGHSDTFSSNSEVWLEYVAGDPESPLCVRRALCGCSKCFELNYGGQQPYTKPFQDNCGLEFPQDSREVITEASCLVHSMGFDIQLDIANVSKHWLDSSDGKLFQSFGGDTPKFIQHLLDIVEKRKMSGEEATKLALYNQSIDDAVAFIMEF